MKKIAGITLISLLILYACNDTERSIASEKEKYQQAKQTLEEKEKNTPADFLLVDSRDKHNLIGQTVVTGTLRNTAKVCTYKDVELELSFFSKTGALLIKTNETIYDKIEPGKLVSFKAKEFAPKGSDSVAIKILGAKTN